MTFFWILIAAAAAWLGLTLWRRRARAATKGRPPPSLARREQARTTAPASDTPTAAAPPAAEDPDAMPADLAALRMLHADDVDPRRVAALMNVLRDIPRPPRVLHQILSPDGLEQMSSSRLVELISAEPLFAAEVLRAGNSPLYGCRTPIASVGQAVTYLGLNTVHAIALQYLVKTSFKSDSLARAQALEQLWLTSATAGELAQRLAAHLGWPHPGALGSAVLLSYLGRVAALSAVSKGTLAKLQAEGTLARVDAEQTYIGLPCSEIGRLLMRWWNLPGAVIDDSADIERVLALPVERFDPARAPRLALGYLCSRVAEGLVSGRLQHPAEFDRADPPSADFFHLRRHAGLPALVEALRSREALAVCRNLAARMEA